MEISRIVVLAIMGTILVLMLKQESPHIGLIISIVTGILIFLYLAAPLREMLNLVQETADKAGVTQTYLAIVLKVVAVAYLSQFGAQICADAGENAIAAKVELAGKVIIMSISIPVLSTLLDLVMGLV